MFVSAKSQTSEKNTLDAMNFALDGGWSVSVKRFDGYITYDSTAMYKGKYPMQIKQDLVVIPPSGDEIFFPVLRGVIYNSFALPSVVSDSLTISLTCKSQGLKKAFMVMSGISIEEKLLYTDTLSINGCDTWYTFVKNVPLRNVAMMELVIAVNGIDTMRFAKSKDEDLTSQQNLWLDRIEMKIGDKKITDYVFSSTATPPLLPKEVFASDSLLNPTFDTPYKDTKIVAFGEAVHGSATIDEEVIQLFKHGIQYDNRKVIMLEAPLEKMLYVNRFIQGDTAFHLDSVKVYFEQALCSEDKWIDFFSWLKKYNAQTNEKVWVLGTDFDFDRLSPLLDLFEYLAAINRTALNPNIAEYCNRLLRAWDKPEEILSFFQSHDCFVNELGLLESKIVEHSLQYIIKRNRQLLVYPITLRDGVMFNNLDFLFNLFSQVKDVKFGVYTHFGHANYSSIETKIISDPPFGALAKQAYGDDYFTVGIFVGEGKTLNNDKGKQWKFTNLQANSVDTFEYWLSQIPGDVFYVPRDFLPSHLMRYRSIGNSPTEFFYLMNPSSRMDGALFIRESKPLMKGTIKIDGDRDRFIYRYMQCLEESRREDFGKKP